MSVEHFYGIVISIGPVLLLVAIIWVLVTGRRSKRAETRTEEATRDLYDDGATTEKRVD